MKEFGVGMLTTVGGILGNLVAAFLEQTWGTFTPVQAVGLTCGVVLSVILIVAFSRLENRKKRQLKRQLQDAREAQHRLAWEVAKGRVPCSEVVNQWWKNRKIISDLKQQLREFGEIVEDLLIDGAEPPEEPKAGCVPVIPPIPPALRGFVSVLIACVAAAFFSSSIMLYGPEPWRFFPTPTSTTVVGRITPGPTTTGLIIPSPTLPITFTPSQSTATTPQHTPLPPATPPSTHQPYPTATPRPRPTETSTRTPSPSRCPNPGVRIDSPLSYSKVWGEVEVRGTADISDFWYYKLELALVEQPNTWSVLGVHDAPVQDGVLGTWDTGAFPPGAYTLRLVVVDKTGNYPDPCEVPITIGQVPGTTPGPLT